MENRVKKVIDRLEAEGALPKAGPPITLEDRCTHTLSEMLNDQAPLFEERYRPAARQMIHTVGREERARIRREMLTAISSEPDELFTRLFDHEGARFSAIDQAEVACTWFREQVDRICPEGE